MKRASEERVNPSYVGSRPDLRALVPSESRRILDLGCATGEVGVALKAAVPERHVTGVELDGTMAAVAARKLDRVVVGDVGQLSELTVAGPYDCVLCGDVLEHLLDPWATLRTVATLLASDGVVVASVPNVGHVDTFIQLLFRKRWPYRARGIHDQTHVRFFALHNVEALFDDAGLEIVELRRNYRLSERPHPVNRFARLVARIGARDLVTFQFLIRAEKARTPRLSAADLAPRTSASDPG